MLLKNDPANGVVHGRRLERSLYDFILACKVHLEEEMARTNPDNALINTLCDSVRLAREMAHVSDAIAWQKYAKNWDGPCPHLASFVRKEDE